MDSIRIFDEHAEEYDAWFEVNEAAYLSEIEALKKFVPQQGRGLEVGVGTGRFAAPLGVKVGVEPAPGAARIARERGIDVCRAKAEKLPFTDGEFDFVVMVTALCFVDDPRKALSEAARVVRPGGRVIIGMIDRGSPPGRKYETKKKTGMFFRHACFYSTEQVLTWLTALGCYDIQTCQTLFGDPGQLEEEQPAKPGHGEGLFAVVCGRREQAK